MAPIKFAKAISNGDDDVYNKGEMWRDFTYIDDLVEGIFKLIFAIPDENENRKVKDYVQDSISPVAPLSGKYWKLR